MDNELRVEVQQRRGSEELRAMAIAQGHADAAGRRIAFGARRRHDSRRVIGDSDFRTLKYCVLASY